MHACLHKSARLLLLGAALASSASCAYVRDRYRDALDMLDIGLTISKKPEFAAFKACTGLTCVGYGDIDGYFVGLGGGKLGSAKYTSKSVGYGLWGNYQNVLLDPDDAANGANIAPNAEQTGLLAAVEGQSNDVACVQQLHIGWTGIVFNIKWAEILDFIVGWTTADISGDDGVERRGWFASKSVEVVQKPDTAPADAPIIASNTTTQVVSAPTPKSTLPDPISAVPDEAPAEPTAKAEPPTSSKPPELDRSDVAASAPTVPLYEPVEVASAQATAASTEAPSATPRSSSTSTVLILARAALAFADQVALQQIEDRQDAAPEPHATASPLDRSHAPSHGFYVVQKGDVGLMQIARVQLGDAGGWRKIAELNGLEPPYIIRAGDVLRLPD